MGSNGKGKEFQGQGLKRYKGVDRVKGWFIWAYGEAEAAVKRDATEGLQSDTGAT